MPSPSRRRFLQAATVSPVGLLAGCTSLDGTSGNGGTTTRGTEATTPTGRSETPTTPTDGCSQDLNRYEPNWEANGPEPRLGFELSLEKQIIEMGDTLVANVTNVTSETQNISDKGRFDIQYHGRDRWASIFDIKFDTPAYTLDLDTYDPGAGIEYRLPFTQSGLMNPIDRSPTLYRCSALEPGNYRFVYFGLIRENQQDGPDPGIKIPFTVLANSS